MGENGGINIMDPDWKKTEETLDIRRIMIEVEIRDDDEVSHSSLGLFQKRSPVLIYIRLKIHVVLRNLCVSLISTKKVFSLSGSNFNIQKRVRDYLHCWQERARRRSCLPYNLDKHVVPLRLRYKLIVAQITWPTFGGWPLVF